MTDELEKIIIQNIKKIPKAPLSVLLSGGIDSSLVLVLLRKVYPDIPIATYSLGRTKDYPDIIHSKIVADLYNTKHHEIILSDNEYNDFLYEYNKVKQYNYKGDVNVYILCSFAKEFSNTIVTGDGGDECFGGYWLHKYPLGHKESGAIKSFEEIDLKAQKYLKEMVGFGFRDYLFKEESDKEDFDTVWEYFIKIMAPEHLAPLDHTAKILNINTYTPLFSKTLTNFLRRLPYKERIGRKIEKDLARKYLPQSVIERRSIGFDAALVTVDTESEIYN